MKKALFAGTFDPITNGHVEIVERGLQLFDAIIVGVGNNSRKNTRFDSDTRIEMIRSVFADEQRVEVAAFDGLTVDFAQKNGAQFLLRGLRSGDDLEYERAIAMLNAHLSHKIETIFLLSSGSLSHISSTFIRELIHYKAPLEGLVPKEILKFISYS